MHYNSQLEFSIIGTLITSYKQSIKMFDKVEPEHFYNKINQDIFTKAKQSYINREDFTEYIIMEYLKQQGYDDKTVMNYILKCTDSVITSYTLKSNLKQLEELYRKRQLEKILQDGLNGTDDFDTVTDILLQNLYDLKKNNKDSKKKMKNMMDSTLEYIDFLDNKDNGNRVDTGFPLIDSILKGMFKGQLIGLAARPGCGKSAFSVNIGLNVAKKGKTVAIFSQEMEAYEIIERMVANQAYIPMDNLIEKLEGLTEQQRDISYTKILTKVNSLSQLPIHIADITKLTTTDIRTECQQLKDLGLIIIDYLQLMTPTKREQNRNLEVAQITRELKILASDLQCPILLLSQLNRAKEETDKPSLNDYRDSGAIEQDLVKSIMLWKADPDENIIGITVNKNRRGSTGDVELHFNGSYMMYTEIGLLRDMPKKKKTKSWDNLND